MCKLYVFRHLHGVFAHNPSIKSWETTASQMYIKSTFLQCKVYFHAHYHKVALAVLTRLSKSLSPALPQ